MVGLRLARGILRIEDVARYSKKLASRNRRIPGVGSASRQGGARRGDGRSAQPLAGADADAAFGGSKRCSGLGALA
jgi:hypothetical protein